MNASRHGAVAAWWRVQKGDLAKDAMIGFLVGIVLFLGACWWDARLQARQDALATAIADRQDGLARDLANQAEVLENIRFVRQIATSREKTAKPFASINLQGAELAGLFLTCADVRHHVGCADFSKANLHEANLTQTKLDGADLRQADLRNANLTLAAFGDAGLMEANLDGVVTREPGGNLGGGASFRDAVLVGATLVHAQIDHSDFTDAMVGGANASEAGLSYGNFRRADLVRARFNHADLRNANFRRAHMTHVDMTSADLRGADFTHAELRGAVLTDVCFDATTIWGSNSPPASSSC